MFYGDHAPPHFHAVYQGEEIKVNINTLEVMEGDMSRRARALVLEWAELHRAELRPAWNLTNRNQEPSKNPPLSNIKSRFGSLPPNRCRYIGCKSPSTAAYF